MAYTPYSVQPGISKSPLTSVMRVPCSNSKSRSLSREWQLREAVLLLFCDPVPSECLRLEKLSLFEWRRLLHWMDTSGLSLYFLDRVIALGIGRMLPVQVQLRLQQNLFGNTERMNAMIAESAAIHHSFQEAGLSYATLKGFSLWPDSVPDLALRSQLDMDFLVAQDSAASARSILEQRGYCLHAISGRSWEFKSSETHATSLKDLYKAGLTRSVELHLEANTASHSSLLARTYMRSLHGIATPVLSPVDLFLGQGLHLYKHLCSEFARAAHIVEFRRHILARHHDRQFWIDLQQQAQSDPHAPMKIGVVVHIISSVMGSFAPSELTSWTVDILPANAAQWIEAYAKRTALTSFPGTKLYLLLQRELASSGISSKRSLRDALLPRHLPPSITPSAPHEALPASIRRYFRQFRYTLFRLRFHLVQGFHYLWESIRWQYSRNGCAE